MTTARRVKKATAETVLQPLSDQIAVIESKMVDVNTLHLYYKNPNVGNVDEIAISLNESGQYKPIVVNIGTLTGRPMEILAGNHTYLGARKDLRYDSFDEDGNVVLAHKPAWDQIYTAFIDVDEDVAKRIVIADNQTARLAEQNDRIVAELLASMPKHVQVGTGFKQIDIEQLTERARKDAAQALERADTIRQEQAATDERIAQARLDQENDPLPRSERTSGIRGAAQDIEPEPEEIVTDEQTRIQTLLELHEEDVYPFRNRWGIPVLLDDMLVEEVPNDLITWAGNEATPDDGKQWYLWQYGLGGMKGLPVDRSILCFFTHDHRFEVWWTNPAYNTARAYVKGLRQAVCPDFSYYDVWPAAMHLYGHYRSMWIGRFLQEAGIKVIPRFQFCDEQSLEFNCLGIPKNPPVLAISLQNFTKEDGSKEDGYPVVRQLVQKGINKIEPTEQIIFYGGNPVQKVIEKLDLHGADAVHVLNYAAMRRGTAFDKKEAGAKLTAKQKRQLQEQLRQEHGIESKPSIEDEDED